MQNKIIMLSIMLAGCGIDEKKNIPNVASADVGANLLMIQMPNKAMFSDAQAQKLTGYSYSLKPTQSSCKTIQAKQYVKPLEGASVKESLPTGCDFNLKIEVGVLAADKKSLSEVMFTNKTKTDPDGLKVLSTDVAAGKSYYLDPKLIVTAAGAKAGFGPQNPTISPEPSGDPNPSLTPGPSIEPSGLTQAQRDVALKDANGGTTKLESYFKSKYLVVDFSSSGCGYCIQMAQDTNASSSLQARLSTDTCQSLTLVPSGEISSWIGMFSTSTFVGKNSRGVSGGLNSFASLFGVNVTGTPTVIIIERATGKVVAKQVGGEPDDLNNICK